jgi:hypothetical protein
MKIRLRHLVEDVDSHGRLARRSPAPSGISANSITQAQHFRHLIQAPRHGVAEPWMPLANSMGANR